MNFAIPAIEKNGNDRKLPLSELEAAKSSQEHYLVQPAASALMSLPKLGRKTMCGLYS